jgi:hypothetical protein
MALLFRILTVTATLLCFGTYSYTAHSTAQFDWLGSIEIASGPGVRGPWQQNESQYDYVDDPTVAIDEQGAISVAWVEQARKDILFQRFSQDGEKQAAKPANVSHNPLTFSWLPRIVIDQGAPQKVFILWQEIIFSGGSHGGDILFARSEDGGATFAGPVNLSSSIGGDGKGRVNRKVWHNGSMDIALGEDGSVYVAWTEYEGPLWFSRSVDGGNSFSHPERMAGGNGAAPARAPALATGPGSTVYLAWTTGEEKSADIRIARSSDSGRTFSKALTVGPGKGYSDAPKLAVDSRGVLHLVYAESENGSFARYDIRHTYSEDEARTFATPRAISHPLPKQFESAAFPSLDIDGKGNIYVTWELYRRLDERPRGLGMGISFDHGKTFSSPVVVPGSSDPGGGLNGSHQGLLMDKLAVNDNGAVAIVNSSLKPGEHSRVWLLRARIAAEPQQANMK